MQVPVTTTTPQPRLRGMRHKRVAPVPDPPLTEYLTPDQVAEALNVSTDTVTRQFENAEGVIDLGSSEKLHRRRKRCLRIPRSTLERFIAEKQVRLRR